MLRRHLKAHEVVALGTRDNETIWESPSTDDCSSDTESISHRARNSPGSRVPAALQIPAVVYQHSQDTAITFTSFETSPIVQTVLEAPRSCSEDANVALTQIEEHPTRWDFDVGTYMHGPDIIFPSDLPHMEAAASSSRCPRGSESDLQMIEGPEDSFLTHPEALHETLAPSNSQFLPENMPINITNELLSAHNGNMLETNNCNSIPNALETGPSCIQAFQNDMFGLVDDPIRGTVTSPDKQPLFQALEGSETVNLEILLEEFHAPQQTINHLPDNRFTTIGVLWPSKKKSPWHMMKTLWTEAVLHKADNVFSETAVSDVMLETTTHDKDESKWNMNDERRQKLMQECSRYHISSERSLSEQRSPACNSSNEDINHQIEDFPSADVLDMSLDLYFRRFHSMLPFIHQPTFDARSAPSSLLFPMCLIGLTMLSPHSSKIFVSTYTQVS